MTAIELGEWVLKFSFEDRRELIRRFGPLERNEYFHTWSLQSHRAQRPPPNDWSLWLIMAGRGFGKTRAGAEWVRAVAEADPAARIALVGATLAEARSVMVEGESGVLACSPPHRRPVFEPSLHRLTWPAGAQATLYSALEAESLRGPQHSHARGSVPKRGLRQRGPRADRRAAPLRDRGRGFGTSGLVRRR